MGGIMTAETGTHFARPVLGVCRGVEWWWDVCVHVMVVHRICEIEGRPA